MDLKCCSPNGEKGSRLSVMCAPAASATVAESRRRAHSGRSGSTGGLASRSDSDPDAIRLHSAYGQPKKLQGRG